MKQMLLLTMLLFIQIVLLEQLYV